MDRKFMSIEGVVTYKDKIYYAVRDTDGILCLFEADKEIKHYENEKANGKRINRKHTNI